ncbi:MAG TPA: pyruvate dehydrogenase complex dihydrolipoamide acetyltransferase [Streptosporangiaceae bacterium]|nr:pyruvate dehydrogenase complex dihydrolipoamide acetyltransferase [Streptosporangiaceae bacterium]
MPEVLMPRLSDTMEEGTLSQWVKHEGDQVRKGDILAVIETDKAAMDMEAYDEGVLARILVGEGSSVPIGTPIAVISAGTGAEAPAAPEGQQAPQAEPVPGAGQAPAPAAPPAGQAPPAPSGPGAAAGAAPSPEAAAPQPPPPPPRQPPSGRASPLARTLARRHGIDLATITGTGPDGRIVRADIEDAIRTRGEGRPAPPPAAAPAAAQPATQPAAVPGEAEEEPLSAVRRLTAERLAESAREAPHFYLTVTAGADALLAFRAEASEHAPGDLKISITDVLIKACATALTTHPEVTSSWGGTKILRHRRIDVGVAVAVGDGLIVPVIRDADRKTLTAIAREAHDLAARARERRVTPDELAGGTFTISNLGMYGIERFTAVINPPQSAILAVGAVTRQPVVRGDQVTIGATMALTLSIDHRVLDGATGAGFLTDLKKLIEEPMRIVL